MSKAVDAAAQGSKPAQVALARIGLTAEQLAALNPEERFTLIAEALSRIQDPGTRAAETLKIFGRSAMSILPLIENGAAGIEDLRKKARELGLVMSSKDAAAAEEFHRTLLTLGAVFRKVVGTIGSAVAGPLKDLAEWVTGYIVRATRWIKQNRGVVVSILKISAGIAVLGIALMALGKIISGMGVAFMLLKTTMSVVMTVLSTLASVIAFICTPVGAVIAAVVALGGVLLWASGAGGKAVSWLGDKFNTLKEDACAAWRGIADALAAGDIGLAAKILWLTLKMEWLRGVKYLLAVWLQVKAFALNIWYAIQAAWEIAVHGIVVAWIEGVSWMKQAWASFSSWWQKATTEVGNWLAKMWVRIKGTFDDSIDVEATVKYLDEMTQAEVKKIDDETKGRKAEIERNRRDAREIESQRHEADLAAVGQKSLDLETEYDRRMADAQREIDAAREEWRKAIQRAHEERGAKEGEAPSDDIMSRIKMKLAGLPDEIEKKATSVRGTFNARALQSLAGGIAADRTAKATEETAKNTKDIREILEEAGFEFE